MSIKAISPAAHSRLALRATRPLRRRFDPGAGGGECPDNEQDGTGECGET